MLASLPLPLWGVAGSLPPPPQLYMESIDVLVASVPRLLLVRGYPKDSVAIYC